MAGAGPDQRRERPLHLTDLARPYRPGWRPSTSSRSPNRWPWAEPEVYFTTSHFNGYAAVLCRLDELDARSLTELVTEAWACRAPRRLVAERFGPA
jgi:hypothetical protein